MNIKNKTFDPNDDSTFRVTATQQMGAACTGGILTSLLMTPLDVVKIRLQAQQKPITNHKCFLYCNGLMDHFCPCVSYNSSTTVSYWYSRPSQFTGTMDALVKITQREGVKSLWSGLSPTLILALPATMVYFVTYDQLKSKLKNVSDARINKQRIRDGLPVGTSLPQPFWVPLLAGCTARIWAATFVSPLELIRTKMQSQKLSYFETHEAVRSLIHYHGFLGLWKGLTPTLLRDVPFSGIYWVIYETVKSYMPVNGNAFLYSFISGSISATVAATITTPFDVLKTVYQIDVMDKEIMTEPPGRGSTMMTTLKNIYAKNGIYGLFSGLTPRLVKVVPACAIMIGSFEYGKSYFYNRNIKKFLQNQDRIVPRTFVI